jgi:hypothetical protein
MLKLDRVEFTCGRSLYRDFILEAFETTAKVFVKILLDGQSTVYVQLDTAAPWSVLDPRVTATLGVLDSDGDRIFLDTRLGRKEGTLVRIPITFLADDGEPFNTEGTFFVCLDWPSGRTFLGYSGLLASMRFALDPRTNHFYFGP